MGVTSAFAKKLAATAEQQHTKFHMQNESDALLSKQIKRYWEDLGFSFPGTETAWSAVFVSWCVKTAGASKAEFLFAPLHAAFVHQAIKNAQSNSGMFQGFTVEAYAPQIGDIIHNNRGGGKFSFDYASKHDDYMSHSAIVIEKGQDTTGHYVLTIGGNESDSIRRTLVYTNADGLIKQRTSNPYICVIKNLK